jgi:hypothetical protein
MQSLRRKRKMGCDRKLSSERKHYVGNNERNRGVWNYRWDATNHNHQAVNVCCRNDRFVLEFNVALKQLKCKILLIKLIGEVIN